VPTRKVPIGFSRCPQCDELRGEGLVHDPQSGVTEPWRFTCLCGGIVCRTCRAAAIHRPISEYWDDGRGPLHVPWFGFLIPCRECRPRV
jgi:hypothetical protein